jgi:hypothetical protein
VAKFGEYLPLKLLRPRVHAAHAAARDVIAASRNTRNVVVLRRILAAYGITRSSGGKTGTGGP